MKVYCDTETSGLIPGLHQVIEFAYIATEPFRPIEVPELGITLGQEFQTYINFDPTRFTWDEQAVKTHRIPLEDALKHGISIEQFQHIIRRIPKEWFIAGFNPAFDLYHIRGTTGIQNAFNFYTHDVNTLGRALVGKAGSKWLAPALNIGVDPNLKHSAPYDCALAQACDNQLHEMIKRKLG